MASPFLYQEDITLIEMVRTNPLLYNMELADYKDNTLKDHIWGQIATAVNKTVADCKRRWKYLRDSYSRCKRKNKSRPGFPEVKKTTKWCYFKHLQFLDGDTADAPAESNLVIKIKTDDSHDEDSLPDQDVEDNDNDDSFEFCTVNNEDTTQDKCEESCSDEPQLETRAKRKRDSYDPMTVNSYSSKRTTVKMKANVSGDEVDSFCLYIRDILKKLSPVLRVEAKTKIFSLMAQYEMRNLNCD